MKFRWSATQGKIFRTFLLMVIVSVMTMSGRQAKADAARDFLVSCSYGVLAGTLVGAASLAFADKPGESLNRVARGASLGLYAGILLGAYIVSGPSAEDEEAAAILGKNSTQWLLTPVVNERGLDGLSAQFRVLEF